MACCGRWTARPSAQSCWGRTCRSDGATRRCWPTWPSSSPSRPPTAPPLLTASPLRCTRCTKYSCCCYHHAFPLLIKQVCLDSSFIASVQFSWLLHYSTNDGHAYGLQTSLMYVVELFIGRKHIQCKGSLVSPFKYMSSIDCG